MDVAYLGALGPSAQYDLNTSVLELEDLHTQVILDLRTLADQGYDVAAYKSEADAAAEQISLLKASLITIQDVPPEISAWRAQQEAARSKLLNILNRTGEDRRTAPELAQLRGLGWAVGVLAVATAVGVYVWTHRAKARKRRR